VFWKNKNSDKKTIPLLAHWTRLYVIVLLLSLVGMAVISGVWISMSAYNHQYELLQLRALQLADSFEMLPGKVVYPVRIFREGPGPEPKGDFRMPLLVQVVDQSGNVNDYGDFFNPPEYFRVMRVAPESYQKVLSGQTVREKFKINSQTWLRVGVAYQPENGTTKAIYVSSFNGGVAGQVTRMCLYMAFLTGIIGMAGWLVLYFIARRLNQPLAQVTAAAQSIAAGDYEVYLPQHLKEQELQQMVTSIKNMAHQLKKMDRLRSELLAGVSHELRTPLTSIRGMIQAVHGKVVDGEKAELFLKISFDEAKRLQQMVEELLVLSSLEAGASVIEQNEVNLSLLVEEVIEQLRILPEFKNIDFEKHLPGEPVYVTGDAGRLRQALLNLLNNCLNASAGKIQISLKVEGNCVNVDIQDNGRGIAEQDQPYIFERFYRRKIKKTKSRGLGIGLTLSRLLAQAHRGNLVLVESVPGNTIFRLTLPLNQG